MLLRVLEVLEVLDDPAADGGAVAALFERYGHDGVGVEPVSGEGGKTEFVSIRVAGRRGSQAGGDAPTLGVIGRLGGLGARPEQIGFVSDGDGAVAAIAAALQLVVMRARGDVLDGDVVVSTHICPDAPTQPHDPVPFMGSPVDMATMNAKEVDEGMDGILSIDTTKGNRLVNHTGIALCPPVRQGWILRPTDGVLDVFQNVTGHLPVLVPLTMQDLTPYGNGLPHLNSILQPWLATSAPVVGVAITAEAAVPGSATGTSRGTDIALAAQFAAEVAKGFGSGRLTLHHADEFAALVDRYGPMRQRLGSSSALPAPKVAPEIEVWTRFWRWTDRKRRICASGTRATSIATSAPITEVLAVIPSVVIRWMPMIAPSTASTMLRISGTGSSTAG